MTSSKSSAPATLTDDLRALFQCPRELWLVYLATFFEFLGVFSFLPTLPLWLSNDFGMSDERAGWWAATFSTLLTLFIFFVGAIADAAGIRTSLIASFALAAVTRLGMALAPTTSVAIPMLLAFGLAYATSQPVLQAAVLRSSTRRAQAFAFSLWYVSFNVAGAMSGPLVIDATRRAFLDPVTHTLTARTIALPLLGEQTLTANRAVMGLGFVFAVASLLVTLLLRKDFENRGATESRKKENPIAALRDVLTDRPFWRFMVLLALLSLVRMMFQHMPFTWPKYVTREQGDAFPFGAVWSINSLLIIFLAPLGTALTRKRRPFDALLLGAAISAVSPFILCFGSTMAWEVAMVLTLTVGEALWSPRLYEYNVSIAPRGRESTYVGLASLPYFLAKLLVGPSSGYLLAHFCPASGPRNSGVMWAIIGASTLLGPIGIWIGRGWIAHRDGPVGSAEA